MKKSKTAFVLGGGGARGAYEVGVWQALLELDIDIDMVLGTSVGSINGAMVAQNDFELAMTLWRELETPMIFDVDIENMQKKKLMPPIEIGGMSLDELMAYAKEFFTDGGIDTTSLHDILNKYVNENAIRASSLEYGLVTVELPTFTPKFLYKDDIPPGKMIDYILASASCYPALKSYEIDGVKYIDGAYADNVPVKMALDRGASTVIAVDLEAIGIVHKADFEKVKDLRLIRSHWDLGNFLVFSRDNAKRIIRLGYLDAMKSYGVYDGFKYTFPKGEFDKRTLPCADSAARIFDLDPLFIYKDFLLCQRLREAANLQLKNMNRELHSQVPTLKGRILENLILLRNKVNTKTLVILLAQSLKNNPGKKIRFSGPVQKLFETELSAAKFLVQQGIV